MLKTKLFFETFFVLFCTFLLNQIATERNLYWSVEEFDSLVHFFGGAFAALFFIWIYFFSGYFKPEKRGFKDFLLVSLIGMVFVSVSWEIYELLIGEAIFAGDNYAYDTALDFLMDFLGGLTACMYGYIKEIDSIKRELTKIADGRF